jgi:putative membrane protein insertion efficiency factor
MKQIAKNIALAVLRGYKTAISPMFTPACRYLPTCSEYAMEAIESHGVIGGSLMALGRVLRCHPFSPGGYDPVLARKCSSQGPDVHAAEFSSDRVS